MLTTSQRLDWLSGRTLTDSGWGDEGALGDDLAARKASDGGALAGLVLNSHRIRLEAYRSADGLGKHGEG